MDLLSLPGEIHFLLLADYLGTAPLALVALSRTCRTMREAVQMALILRPRLLRTPGAVGCLIRELPEYRGRFGAVCERALALLPVHRQYEQANRHFIGARSSVAQQPAPPLSWQLVRRYVPLPCNDLRLRSGESARILAILAFYLRPALEAREDTLEMVLRELAGTLASASQGLDTAVRQLLGPGGPTLEALAPPYSRGPNYCVLLVSLFWLLCSTSAPSSAPPSSRPA